MARNTRAQRRARRRGAEAPAAAPEQPKVTQRARSRQQQVRPAAQPQKQQTGRREQRKARFVSESWAELKKVEWPSRTQVITGTVVVIIACAIVGAYLYAADFILRNLVEKVLI
jgi:preprotein translocase subunit SecE